MWTELRFAIEDGRMGLPYAPYLIFMTERVTRFYFPKDGMNTIYKIEKTQLVVATQGAGSSHAHVDIPKSLHSRSRSGGKMKKFGK